MARLRIVSICFDHMHMGNLLRQVHDHPEAEPRASSTPTACMTDVIDAFAILEALMFTDFDVCMAIGPHDKAILCAAAVERTRCTLRLAPHGVHVLVEKPYAASMADARHMIAAMAGTGRQLAINWPLR